VPAKTTAPWHSHLDLHIADAAEQAAEVARLVSLGSYPKDPDFVVLADTEGNLSASSIRVTKADQAIVG